MGLGQPHPRGPGRELLWEGSTDEGLEVEMAKSNRGCGPRGPVGVEFKEARSSEDLEEVWVEATQGAEATAQTHIKKL